VFPVEFCRPEHILLFILFRVNEWHLADVVAGQVVYSGG
jgi:hypothetical protein